MLVEFDKLKRDYQEHQNEIHAKLIAIMGERLSAHCKSLQEIPWDVPPPRPGPNAYVEQLVKETITLHKVLSKYLGGGSTEVRLPDVETGLPPSNKSNNDISMLVGFKSVADYERSVCLHQSSTGGGVPAD
jgi:Vps54-like protein